MSDITLNNSTLAEAVWNEGLGGTSIWLRRVTLAIGGSLLLWLSAKIQVPFWPVPMTLQTLVVLGLGMAFGPRLAIATVVLYLAQGAAGLPVFAGTPEKGIGLAYMMGPTGGYLFGFVLAAGIVGWLAEQGWDRNIVTTALAMLVGNLVIYLPGLAWLTTFIGVEKAYLFGMQPFLAGDALKLAIAALALPLSWKLIDRKA